jgi:IclR family transcriptional regulator, KDG regulon repressor
MEGRPFAEGERSRSNVQSLTKALDLLEAFTFEQPEMALGEISLKLGLAKSTVHKVLHTLLVRGYVAQDPVTRRYGLGLRNWQLGSLAAANLDVRRAAATHLHRLAALTGEQVTLWVPEQQVAVCVERVDSRHQVRTYTRLGMVANPLDLASGRCLLAFRPQAELAELLPVLLCGHEASVDPEGVAARLAGIAKQGYDVTDRSPETQGVGVAAPVRDHAGRPVAAVAVSGPVIRFDDEAVEVLVPHVVDVAGQISAELGFRD